jgi:lipopolysaccharide assembly outer membrane protein LptD (OstA)
LSACPAKEAAVTTAPRLLLALLLPLAVACTDREAQQRAAAEAARARAEAAATQAARQVDEVLAAGKVEIAYAYAVDVVSRYPGTAATQALQARLPG